LAYIEEIINGKIMHLIVYEAPQATRLSGGASWAFSVGSRAKPRPKNDYSAFKRQMLLVEMFLVNWGPVSRPLLTENMHLVV